MELSTTTSGIVTITLGEKFDFSHVSEFRSTYEQLDKSEVTKVVINFSKTRYMDSSALGMLLNLHNSLGGNGVNIHLTQTNEKIKKILTISRFDTKFTIE